MYVCMYVHMYVYMYIYIYIYTLYPRDKNTEFGNVKRSSTRGRLVCILGAFLLANSSDNLAQACDVFYLRRKQHHNLAQREAAWNASLGRTERWRSLRLSPLLLLPDRGPLRVDPDGWRHGCASPWRWHYQCLRHRCLQNIVTAAMYVCMHYTDTLIHTYSDKQEVVIFPLELVDSTCKIGLITTGDISLGRRGRAKQ